MAMARQRIFAIKRQNRIHYSSEPIPGGYEIFAEDGYIRRPDQSKMVTQQVQQQVDRGHNENDESGSETEDGKYSICIVPNVEATRCETCPPCCRFAAKWRCIWTWIVANLKQNTSLLLS